MSLPIVESKLFFSSSSKRDRVEISGTVQKWSSWVEHGVKVVGARMRLSPHSFGYSWVIMTEMMMIRWRRRERWFVSKLTSYTVCNLWPMIGSMNGEWACYHCVRVRWVVVWLLNTYNRSLWAAIEREKDIELVIHVTTAMSLSWWVEDERLVLHVAVDYEVTVTYV